MPFLDDLRGWWEEFEGMNARGALFGAAAEGGTWYSSSAPEGLPSPLRPLDPWSSADALQKSGKLEDAVVSCMVMRAAACVRPGGAETPFSACQLNVVSISVCGVLHWLAGMLAAERIPYYGQNSGVTGLNSGSLMLHLDRLQLQR